MFTTKKKFEEALAKERIKLEDEFRDKTDRWHESRYRDDENTRVNQRIDALTRRVYALEKQLGLVEESKCPFVIDNEKGYTGL